MCLHSIAVWYKVMEHKTRVSSSVTYQCLALGHGPFATSNGKAGHTSKPHQRHRGSHKGLLITHTWGLQIVQMDRLAALKSGNNTSRLSCYPVDSVIGSAYTTTESENADILDNLGQEADTMQNHLST
jgi:hypothetical protein